MKLLHVSPSWGWVVVAHTHTHIHGFCACMLCHDFMWIIWTYINNFLNESNRQYRRILSTLVGTNQRIKGLFVCPASHATNTHSHISLCLSYHTWSYGGKLIITSIKGLTCGKNWWSHGDKYRHVISDLISPCLYDVMVVTVWLEDNLSPFFITLFLTAQTKPSLISWS